jgi:hypothetical protein
MMLSRHGERDGGALVARLPEVLPPRLHLTFFDGAREAALLPDLARGWKLEWEGDTAVAEEER